MSDHARVIGEFRDATAIELGLAAHVEALREAGQALRDCPFKWDSSTEAADAADAWDELVKP